MPDLGSKAGCGRFAGLRLGWRLHHGLMRVSGRGAAIALQLVARVRVLRVVPRAALVPIERLLIAVSEQGVFDPVFYRTQNSDVAESGVEALRHYLWYGWREGRSPNALFDDEHYRIQAGLGRDTPVSALGHYLAFGCDVGLSPVPGFDAWVHRRDHPDLAIARIDPYQALLTERVAQGTDRPDLETARSALARIGSIDTGLAPEVDVIIPVYRGHAETLNTLRTVLCARNETRANILVVNDCCPNRDLASDLRDLAERGLICLSESMRNRGFVASINSGMRANPERDVIWLNADTEVYDGWIDRLRAAAYRCAKVATVTPLTNNGTICSYPRPDADNPGRLELGWQALDGLAARVNAGRCVESPTAVGFATYVRRDAIRVIGDLDEEAFGRGYGEENDFSQRALAFGWKNLIATDVFVRHFGATSFRGTRADRIEAAMKVMDRRHPGYRDSVRDFQAADPVGPSRRALDVARLRRLSGNRNVLIVTHSLGGGTQQHVHEEIARLEGAGASVFVLSGGAGGGATARLSHARAGEMPALATLSLDGDDLWVLLRGLALSEVQLHHLIDFPPNAARLFARRLASLGVAYDFVLHDYFAICPRINMVDSSGHYCGEAGLDSCKRCMVQRGSRVGRVDIELWRAHYSALLHGARTIRAPDRDGADRLARYFPTLDTIEAVPHEDLRSGAIAREDRSPGPLRIAVIGAIGPTKGFDTLLALARHCQRRNVPIDLRVIGYTRNDRAARAAGISVTGAYLNHDLDGLIEKVDPDLIWIPSVWPETYCYTLSFALRSGRAIAAFDLGAQASRLRAAGRGHLIDLDLSSKPTVLLAELTRAATQQIAAHAL